MLRRWSRLLKKAGESPGVWGDSRLALSWPQPALRQGKERSPGPFFTSPTSPCFCRWTQQNLVFTHQVITFRNTTAGKIEVSPQRKAWKHLLKRFLRAKYHMLRLAITCHKASPWPWLLPASETWLMESAPGADRLLRFLTPHVCLLACSVTVTSLRQCYFWQPSTSLPS